MQLIRNSLLLLSIIGSSAYSADSPIKLTPSQVETSGIQSSLLGDFLNKGGVGLPAQVIVPPAQIEVMAAPVATLVTNVRVAYGDVVKKGQPLLRLQGGGLLELQRDFSTARAQAGLAAENRRRDEALFADGIISQGRLSATRAAETQAQALAGEKQQSLRLSGLADSGGDAGSGGNGERPGVAELRAPFDGVVLEVAAQPGQRVDATTPLLKLARLAPLWLEIQASSAQAARLAAGDQVQIPGCSVSGEIRLIAPQMQLASQSQLVRAEIAKPGGCVKPFQFVHVTVTSRTAAAKDSWRLPVGALVRHQGKAWVFVAADGGYLPVTVSVLDESAESVTVAGELTAQSRIVTRGVATLKASWLGLGSSGTN
jgi:cobalt-zinc-cadmium efflux system membrane fusion protein